MSAGAAHHGHDHHLPHLQEVFWGFVLRPVVWPFRQLGKLPGVRNLLASRQRQKDDRSWYRAQGLRHPADFIHPRWDSLPPDNLPRAQIGQIAADPDGRLLLLAVVQNHLERMGELLAYKNNKIVYCPHTEEPLPAFSQRFMPGVQIPDNPTAEALQPPLVGLILEAFGQPQQQGKNRLLGEYGTECLGVLDRIIERHGLAPSRVHGGLQMAAPDIIRARQTWLHGLFRLKDVGQDPKLVTQLSHWFEARGKDWEKLPVVQKRLAQFGIAASCVAIAGFMATRLPELEAHDVDLRHPASIALQVAGDSLQTVDFASRALAPVVIGLAATRRRRIPQAASAADSLIDAGTLAQNLAYPIVTGNLLEIPLSALATGTHIYVDVKGGLQSANLFKRLWLKTNGMVERMAGPDSGLARTWQRVSGWAAAAGAIGLSSGISLASMFFVPFATNRVAQVFAAPPTPQPPAAQVVVPPQSSPAPSPMFRGPPIPDPNPRLVQTIAKGDILIERIAEGANIPERQAARLAAKLRPSTNVDLIYPGEKVTVGRYGETVTVSFRDFEAAMQIQATR